MRRLDPFVRSCFLTVVVAAVPAFVIAILAPREHEVSVSTYLSFGYSLILLIVLVTYARRSRIWRTPVAVNIPFFVFVGLATLTL